MRFVIVRFLNYGRPNGDTLHSEQGGKVYTYNCFTFDEIDQFYESHEGRIENAHFYPILAGQVDANSGLDEGTEDDC